MTDILHCPSRQQGTILGYHHGQKYFMVKTDTGQFQQWAQHSTQLLRKDYMTNKILMKLTSDKGKMFNIIERVFNNVNDAAEYLAELTRLDNIKDTDRTGQQAKLSNGWSIACNYDIREIAKKIPPKKDLWDWYPFDLQKKAKKLGMPSYKQTSPELSSTPIKNKFNGKTVKLQDLTNDGRAARVILRELVRKKQVVKNGRWEWQEGDPQLEIVRKALSK